MAIKIDEQNAKIIGLLSKNKEVSNFFMDIINGDEYNDNVTENFQELFSSVLTTLLHLSNVDCVWDPKYSKEINTVADIEKYQSKASVSVLKEILLTPYSVIEFALAVERIYENDYTVFTRKLNSSIENHIPIHNELKNVILKQTSGIPDFKTLLEVGIEEIVSKSSNPDQVLFVIEISLNMFTARVSNINRNRQ